MKYYSQLGQDKWVHEIYGDLRGGYFVEVGAYNGVKISNTYFLEKELEWNGICVEPLPGIFEELEANRTCICENVCVASHSGLVHFKCRGKGSMIVDLGARGKIVTREAKTLEQILDKNNAPKYIEYLSLDTEGNELDILQVFPFDKYEFGVMTIEHNAQVGQAYQDRRELMVALLTSKGYVRSREVSCDDWYINPRRIKNGK
jgi:FkbM family methyltransferase